MDDKNLDAAIYIFTRIRQALETLQITATRNNLDTTLGCIQLCDKGIVSLNAEKEAKNKEHKNATASAAMASVVKANKEES